MFSCCLLWVIILALVEANFTSTYISRPELVVPGLNITVYDDASVSSGYIFIAPIGNDQTGPYIYDTKGENLVWTGYASVGGGNTNNFQVCKINGTANLCYFRGVSEAGYGRGQPGIMDNSYRMVNSVQSIAHVPADGHEFNVLESENTALVSAYLPVRYDLSSYGITNGQGWLLSGVVQEIDIATGDSIFEWRSIDHVYPNASYAPLNVSSGSMLAGDGLAAESGWDYFHLNAIDKNSEGDYLISSRHCSTVFKVSGADGSIIWRLGGVDSDFTLDNFTFNYQHDTRFLSENETTTIISLFDNASDDYNTVTDYSAGKIIAINNSTMTATLLQEYSVSNGTQLLLSGSQGNVQMLDSGNVFIGWGSNAVVSEHTKDGNLVFYADFDNGETTNYRAYKFNWTGYPTDTPAVYAYAHNTTAPTVISVSWNGATEVTQWAFYGSDIRTGNFTALGTVNRTGFETNYTSSEYQGYVIAKALASDGSELGKSTPFATFVPGEALADYCNTLGCPVVYSYNETTS
ncbi:MAG: hypothetical protein M1834_001973 [Cirrosporium novae-zelandiae]|nr:MAG: hypothetical protein M1834_001973 [Cirrosporium novae-zelandiae]